ncbi:MAG: cyclic nucleotide-binding domain-containing protein [Methylococcaceae bacterium]
MLLVEKFKEDTIIFKEGDNDRTMFIVLDGSVQLYVTRNGREIDLNVIHKNDFFGEIEMYSNKPRSVSAKAMTNVRAAILKNRMELEQFIAQNPAFSGKSLRVVGQRLADTNAEL